MTATPQTRPLAKWEPEGIKNEADGRAFLTDVIAVLGRAYHIDTHFDEYINPGNGEQTFDGQEAARLTACNERLFDVFADPYEAALMMMETGGRPVEGTRVRLRRDVDRYPFFIAPEGATGTVVECSCDALLVKMDEHIDGCEEWDNEIMWTEDSLSYALEDLAVIGRDEPGEVVDADRFERPPTQREALEELGAVEDGEVEIPVAEVPVGCEVNLSGRWQRVRSCQMEGGVPGKARTFTVRTELERANTYCLDREVKVRARPA